MVKHWALLVAALLLVFIEGSPVIGDDSADATFKIIVQSDNETATLTPSELSHIFLKRTTKWDGGSEIQPADQSYSLEITGAFCEEVHRRDVGWLRAYWRKQVFGGRRYPPPQMPNDAAVIEHVLNSDGGIGYIAGSTEVPNGLKIVPVAR